MTKSAYPLGILEIVVEVIERRKTFCSFSEFLVWYFHMLCFVVPLGCLLVMKTLKDEWYAVIKA